MTLEWFKLDLLNSGDPADRPCWMESWVHFVAELQSTYGPHNPITDAEHQLEHLRMKDAHRVTRYIVDFNQLALQVQDYGDGALRCLFYSSLPDHLKDEIARLGKPLTLHGLRALCQEINMCYWERKDEISHTTKSQPTLSATKSSSSGGNSSNSGQEKSKTGNPSSSANSGSSKVTSNQPPSSSRPVLTNKLGQDGKLSINGVWKTTSACSMGVLVILQTTVQRRPKRPRLVLRPLLLSPVRQTPTWVPTPSQKKK